MRSRLSRLFLFLLVGATACTTQEIGAFDPQGYGSVQIDRLWWIILVISVIVYAFVMGTLILALLRRRREAPDIRQSAPPRGSHTYVTINGIVLPAVILIGVFFLSLMTMNGLNPDTDENTLVIEVTGRRWWWEVRYPDSNFVTANEIHIPVNQPVRIRLISDDVIHSFWVPSLHGKVDMIPGQVNEITLQAETVGSYRGQCAEYCGTQHGRMAFYVIADTAEGFDAWLANQQEPAVEPEAEDSLVAQGKQVFLTASFAYCHSIRGTAAQSDVGPDLTHLASRQTIGAGILPNTRGNLAGWVVNAQSIKPGSLMPAVPIAGEDLQALLAYLESLE